MTHLINHDSWTTYDDAVSRTTYPSKLLAVEVLSRAYECIPRKFDAVIDGSPTHPDPGPVSLQATERSRSVPSKVAVRR